MHHAIAIAVWLALLPCEVGAQAPVAWRLEETARIGSVNDPEDALTRIGQILIGESGEIIVTQPIDQQIRMYDAAGRSIRTLGGKGAGPGEFQTISSIGFLADTLYATDEIQKRISFFGGDGALQRVVTTLSSPMMGARMPELILPTVPQVLLPDGSALVLPGVPVAWHEAGGARAPYLRMNRGTGGVLDTIVWREHARPLFYMMHNGTRMGAWLPFPRDPLYAYAADGSGVVVVVRDVADESVSLAVYRVRKLNARGDVVFDTAVQYSPQPVPAVLVERAAESARDFMSRRHSPPSVRAIEAHLRDEGLVPETMVPVTDVVTGQDGSTWIRREEGEPDADVRWDVLNASGRLVGMVKLPARQFIKAARNDVIVVVELDDLDVPFIVRYDVRRMLLPE